MNQYMWHVISYVKLKVMVYLLCLFAWRRYHYMDLKAKEVKFVMDKLDLPTLLNNWEMLSFLIFLFSYSEVWKVMEAGSRVWELAAYSSESRSLHKTVSCKLEVIMLHLPQNHLSEDSYKLKCLNNIRRQNILFPYLFI